MTEPCRDIEPLLSAWLDGELDDAERRQVSDHLTVCGVCQSDVDGLAATRVMLRNLPVRRLPEEVRAADGGAAEADGDKSARRYRVAAGVLVATGVAVVLAWGDPGQPAERTVAVPVDVFVADHVARTTDTGVLTPVLVDAP